GARARPLDALHLAVERRIDRGVTLASAVLPHEHPAAVLDPREAVDGLEVLHGQRLRPATADQREKRLRAARAGAHEHPEVVELAGVLAEARVRIAAHDVAHALGRVAREGAALAADEPRPGAGAGDEPDRVRAREARHRSVAPGRAVPERE